MNYFIKGLIAFSLIFNAPAHANKVTIICEEGMYPFSWSEGNIARGIVVELVQAMLDEMNRTDTILIYPWSRTYKAGLTVPNTLICTMAKTKQREALFKWVGEVFSSPPVLLALKSRTDIKADSLEDLKKYRIGTHRSSFREKHLISKGFVVGENLVSENNNNINYRKLNKGRIDLWSVPLLLAYEIIEEEELDPEEDLQIIYTLKELPQGQDMAFNIETPDEIVDAFRHTLKTLKENGTYDRIMSKYIDK
ncbi:substrate-binding periplasmic protein [Vibrio atypicus]|uniref:substrate-binding periplasmic protein n=1 Tax=Vibrio atypicus TaxID=558271 RepID=UPI00135CEEDC|nr:ABC transporter substrate-binding protein [Vibrio atypicus]